MKKCFFCVLVFLFAGSSAYAETINMGFFQLKPHAFVEDSSTEPVGASIEYFNIILEKMGCNVSWKGPFPFLRLTKELKNGSLDGAIVYSKNPEREKYLYCFR